MARRKRQDDDSFQAPRRKLKRRHWMGMSLALALVLFIVFLPATAHLAVGPPRFDQPLCRPGASASGGAERRSRLVRTA